VADGPRGAPAEGAPWVAGGGRKGAAHGRGGDAWLACVHLPEVGFRRAGGRVPAVEKAVAVVVPSRWRKAGGRAPAGCGGARQHPSVVAFSQLLCFPFFARQRANRYAGRRELRYRAIQSGRLPNCVQAHTKGGIPHDIGAVFPLANARALQTTELELVQCQFMIPILNAYFQTQPLAFLEYFIF
jgi:hypothetical protein